MPKASDFRICTVIKMKHYLKNNSLLHSPMSAADRVQKVPFGKWTQLHGEAMSGPMRSSVVVKNRALKIRAHLSILTFLGFLEVFRI